MKFARSKTQLYFLNRLSTFKGKIIGIPRGHTLAWARSINEASVHFQGQMEECNADVQ